MKFASLILASILSWGASACTQNKPTETTDSNMMDKKVLVVFFSATGTTARQAGLLAEATSATLYEIQPEQPYTSADLDWNDRKSRSSIEMNDESSRPSIQGKVKDMNQYDVIFIGYPIWWDLAPRVVYSFIEKNNLKGKTVIPFATSGGSSIAGSVKDLKNKYPEIKWTSGKLLNRADKSDIETWINGLDISDR